MVKLLTHQAKAFKGLHKGLTQRYEGPFPITKRVGKVSYQLELPPKLKIHLVFHVSLLKPYYADMEDPSHSESTRAPTSITASFDKEVDTMLRKEKGKGDLVKWIPKKGKRYMEYLVKWKGQPNSEASCEHKESLW